MWPKRERALPKTLTLAEVDHLLHVAGAIDASAPLPARLRAARLNCLIEVIYATGLRVSELVALPRSAAERNARMLSVRGKGGKERLVPLNDAAKAATYEVEWWRVHRAHQHDDDVTEEELVTALIDLYSYVYSIDRDAVRRAAQRRVDAMDLSDRWVRAGCHRDDPLLAAERRTLVASYTALRAAVEP